jgi:hypothetical protein
VLVRVVLVVAVTAAGEGGPLIRETDERGEGEKKKEEEGGKQKDDTRLKG